MTHEIFYLQQQSHETLTLILVGGGVSSRHRRWRSRCICTGRVATPARLPAWRVKSARRRVGDDGVENGTLLPTEPIRKDP
jgi:hypothetical protein